MINSVRLLAVSSWHTHPGQLFARLRLMVRRRVNRCRAAIAQGSGLARRRPLAAVAIPPRAVFPPRVDATADGGGVLWARLAQRLWPITRPLDWHPPDFGHRLEKLLLHGMEYAEALDDLTFERVVTDWIERNPPYGPDYWLGSWNGYALSIRVVVWMQQLVERHGRLSRRFTDLVMLSLEQQLDFLVSHLEVDIGGNHLLRNTRALLWGGRFFDGAKSARWLGLGRELLARELDAQILPDGFHFEVSPAYHLQVFGDLLECFALIRDVPEQRDGLRDRLAAALHSMAQVVADVTHPDGLISLFNDGWLHMSHAPRTCLAVYERLLSRRVSPRAMFACRAAGYFGVRRDQDLVIADAGPIGPDHLPAHGHGDILSFEWTLAGQRVIVDAGVSEYAEGPWRAYARSTRAHNTVTIGNGDQCEFWRSFRVARRARVTVHQYCERADGFVLEAGHDGYRHLDGAPIHTRRFDASAARISITDRVVDGEGQPVRARLLLHPDFQALPSANGLLLTNGTIRATLRATHDVTVDQGWWSPEFNTRIPTRQLVITYGPAPCEGGFTLEGHS